MKMNRLVRVFFLVLLQSTCFYGQQKMINIEYEIFYNTELPNTQYANLYINPVREESIFVKQNSNTEAKQVTQKDDNSIAVTYKSKRNASNYFNFKIDSLFTVESSFGWDYLVSEKIPKLQWVLVDETRVKDAITLSKAICEFRGRKFIAWYSMEYPLKYGPWKLHGLPGLIFEVYDETKRYNWFIKKITYEDSNSTVFTINNNDCKKVTIEEFSKIKYDTKTVNESLYAKMPRGTTVVSSEMHRNGIEIKFEWEK